MDAININHAQVLYSSVGVKVIGTVSAPTETATPAETNSSATEIKLSPEASSIAYDPNIKPRFSSMEEQSAHKTRVVAQWVTLDELESGTRRPFATAEDERLSHLTLKELLEEGNKLPRVDKNGHLQSSFSGTEQGDRIGIAIANIVLETQYTYRKAAANVETAVSDFKQHIEKKFNIDPKSYDIVFSNGKITAIGKGSDMASQKDLQRIQKILEKPDDLKVAMSLSLKIDEFNKAAMGMVANELTQYIYGPTQDPYLEKNISMDWLMEGMNYSNATKNTQINHKYLDLIASAREKYHAAIKDGTHLSNYDIDPGILELTQLRKNIDAKA